MMWAHCYLQCQLRAVKALDSCGRAVWVGLVTVEEEVQSQAYRGAMPRSCLGVAIHLGCEEHNDSVANRGQNRSG